MYCRTQVIKAEADAGFLSLSHLALAYILGAAKAYRGEAFGDQRPGLSDLPAVLPDQQRPAEPPVPLPQRGHALILIVSYTIINRGHCCAMDLTNSYTCCPSLHVTASPPVEARGSAYNMWAGCRQSVSGSVLSSNKTYLKLFFVLLRYCTVDVLKIDIFHVKIFFESNKENLEISHDNFCGQFWWGNSWVGKEGYGVRSTMWKVRSALKNIGRFSRGFRKLVLWSFCRIWPKQIIVI